MTDDAAYLELIASFEQALEAAKRSLLIARTLAESHGSGQRPHDAVIAAYLASVERDEDKLPELRAKVAQFNGLADVPTPAGPTPRQLEKEAASEPTQVRRT